MQKWFLIGCFLQTLFCLPRPLLRTRWARAISRGGGSGSFALPFFFLPFLRLKIRYTCGTRRSSPKKTARRCAVENPLTMLTIREIQEICRCGAIAKNLPTRDSPHMLMTVNQQPQPAILRVLNLVGNPNTRVAGNKPLLPLAALLCMSLTPTCQGRVGLQMRSLYNVKRPRPSCPYMAPYHPLFHYLGGARHHHFHSTTSSPVFVSSLNPAPTRLALGHPSQAPLCLGWLLELPPPTMTTYLQISRCARSFR